MACTDFPNEQTAHRAVHLLRFSEKATVKEWPQREEDQRSEAAASATPLLLAGRAAG